MLEDYNIGKKQIRLHHSARMATKCCGHTCVDILGMGKDLASVNIVGARSL